MTGNSPGGGGAAPDLGDPVNDGSAYIALMAELRAMLDELEAEKWSHLRTHLSDRCYHDKIRGCGLRRCYPVHGLHLCDDLRLTAVGTTC
ncbi:hypothetical protein OK016_28600 [Vibrio chagasii]|nr:hypothetical protein [Vibrio chagasii]